MFADLDGAIDHAMEIVSTCENIECVRDHAQLACWLTELRELRDHMQDLIVNDEDDEDDDETGLDDITVGIGRQEILLGELMSKALGEISDMIQGTEGETLSTECPQFDCPDCLAEEPGDGSNPCITCQRVLQQMIKTVVAPLKPFPAQLTPGSYPASPYPGYPGPWIGDPIYPYPHVSYGQTPIGYVQYEYLPVV